ncbi:MAG TPA: hypothetical protein ENI42_05730, partial [Thermoplasmatales archaeon]|nr:hypothetical protein [Thermoplasmatales archaeon]
MGGRRFVSVSRVAVFTLFLLFTRSIDVVSVEQIDGEDSEHLLDSNVKYNFSWVACYVFMEGNVKRGYANVSLNDVYELHQMFEQLKHAVVDTPFGEEVQVLKLKFINKLKSYGLLPGELSRDDVYLALNPEWLGRLQNKAWLQTIFLKNLLGYSNTAFFCSIASEGSGRTFPVILLPRPRAVMFWKATSEYDYGTVTTVGEIMNGRGFIATGSQTGTAIGFLGIGLTFGTPLGPIYGFIGYALMVRVTAEDIQSYPPNAAPIISEVNPPNGERDVPPTLSKLS